MSNKIFEDINFNTKEEKELEISDAVSKLIIKLIKKRLELKLSQRDLAELTGIKQPMIARIESFDSTPRIDTLIKIANALNLKIDILNELQKNTPLIINFTIIKEPKIYFENSKNHEKILLSC